jgi:crotonobetainyl-CoA:carnitine CoA-transferase CaiB-like acyl-CoA transferase
MDHVQVYNDPQTKARKMVEEIDHPSAGKTKTLGIHIKLLGTPGAVRRPAPMHGEHTDEILAELAEKQAAE